MINPNSKEINETKKRLRDFKRDLRSYNHLNKISDIQLREFSIDLDKDELNSKIEITEALIKREEKRLVLVNSRNEADLRFIKEMVTK